MLPEDGGAEPSHALQPHRGAAAGTSRYYGYDEEAGPRPYDPPTTATEICADQRAAPKPSGAVPHIQRRGTASGVHTVLRPQHLHLSPLFPLPLQKFKNKIKIKFKNNLGDKLFGDRIKLRSKNRRTENLRTNYGRTNLHGTNCRRDGDARDRQP